MPGNKEEKIKSDTAQDVVGTYISQIKAKLELIDSSIKKYHLDTSLNGIMNILNNTQAQLNAYLSADTQDREAFITILGKENHEINSYVADKIKQLKINQNSLINFIAYNKQAINELNELLSSLVQVEENITYDNELLEAKSQAESLLNKINLLYAIKRNNVKYKEIKPFIGTAVKNYQKALNLEITETETAEKQEQPEFVSKKLSREDIHQDNIVSILRNINSKIDETLSDNMLNITLNEWEKSIQGYLEKIDKEELDKEELESYQHEKMLETFKNKVKEKISDNQIKELELLLEEVDKERTKIMEINFEIADENTKIFVEKQQEKLESQRSRIKNTISVFKAINNNESFNMKLPQEILGVLESLNREARAKLGHAETLVEAPAAKPSKNYQEYIHQQDASTKQKHSRIIVPGMPSFSLGDEKVKSSEGNPKNKGLYYLLSINEEIKQEPKGIRFPSKIKNVKSTLQIVEKQYEQLSFELNMDEPQEINQDDYLIDTKGIVELTNVPVAENIQDIEQQLQDIKNKTAEMQKISSGFVMQLGENTALLSTLEQRNTEVAQRVAELPQLKPKQIKSSLKKIIEAEKAISSIKKAEALAAVDDWESEKESKIKTYDISAATKELEKRAGTNQHTNEMLKILNDFASSLGVTYRESYKEVPTKQLYNKYKNRVKQLTDWKKQAIETAYQQNITDLNGIEDRIDKRKPSSFKVNITSYLNRKQEFDNLVQQYKTTLEINNKIINDASNKVKDELDKLEKMENKLTSKLQELKWNEVENKINKFNAELIGIIQYCQSVPESVQSGYEKKIGLAEYETIFKRVVNEYFQKNEERIGNFIRDLENAKATKELTASLNNQVDDFIKHQGKREIDNNLRAKLDEVVANKQQHFKEQKEAYNKICQNISLKVDEIQNSNLYTTDERKQFFSSITQILPDDTAYPIVPKDYSLRNSEILDSILKEYSEKNKVVEKSYESVNQDIDFNKRQDQVNMYTFNIGTLDNFYQKNTNVKKPQLINANVVDLGEVLSDENQEENIRYQNSVIAKIDNLILANHHGIPANDFVNILNETKSQLKTDLQKLLDDIRELPDNIETFDQVLGLDAYLKQMGAFQNDEKFQLKANDILEQRFQEYKENKADLLFVGKERIDENDITVKCRNNDPRRIAAYETIKGELQAEIDKVRAGEQSDVIRKIRKNAEANNGFDMRFRNERVEYRKNNKAIEQTYQRYMDREFAHRRREQLRRQEADVERSTSSHSSGGSADSFNFKDGEGSPERNANRRVKTYKPQPQQKRNEDLTFAGILLTLGAGALGGATGATIGMVAGFVAGGPIGAVVGAIAGGSGASVLTGTIVNRAFSFWRSGKEKSEKGYQPLSHDKNKSDSDERFKP